MKRVAGTLLAFVLVGIPQFASAQVGGVVSDPVLERYATMNWTRDANNAINIAKTAVQAVEQLKTQIATYQNQLREMQQLPQTVWRQASGEISQLANVTKAGYAISAYDTDGSGQLAKMFDPTSYQQVLPAGLDALWGKQMQSILGNAANANNARVAQMQTEEQQIQYIRNLANTQGLTEKQALQISLMIADQQLQEMRMMERMMAQHFDTQYAFMQQQSQVHDGIRQALADQYLQQFWSGAVRGSYQPVPALLQQQNVPVVTH